MAAEADRAGADRLGPEAAEVVGVDCGDAASVADVDAGRLGWRSCPTNWRRVPAADTSTSMFRPGACEGELAWALAPDGARRLVDRRVEDSAASSASIVRQVRLERAASMTHAGGGRSGRRRDAVPPAAAHPLDRGLRSARRFQGSRGPSPVKRFILRVACLRLDTDFCHSAAKIRGGNRSAGVRRGAKGRSRAAATSSWLGRWGGHEDPQQPPAALGQLVRPTATAIRPGPIHRPRPVGPTPPGPGWGSAAGVEQAQALVPGRSRQPHPQTLVVCPGGGRAARPA